MADTPEGRVKKQVKALLKEHGAWFNMPVPTGYGVPMLDFIGCHQGKFFAVETKAPGEKLTPRQEATAALMEAAGAKVFVVGMGFIRRTQPGGVSYESYTGMVELEAWLLLHS